MDTLPPTIRKEIEMIKRGKKLRMPTKLISEDKLLSQAKKNLIRIMEIAQTEPIFSYFNFNGFNRAFFFLENLNPYDSHPTNSKGHLALTVINGKAKLSFWRDNEDPNASFHFSQDHLHPEQLFDDIEINEDDLKRWQPNSLRKFAELTERNFWKLFKKWLRSERLQFNLS